MSSSKAAANKIATVIIPVQDQDRMLEFYVDKLGFDKRVDVPFGGGMRWIEIALGEQVTTIALAPPHPEANAGNRETGISLQTDDIDGFHAKLKSAGVDVDAEVQRMGEPVPPMFWLRDPEGNTLMVVQ
ncbi:MAG TPA: VOC family protein [Mycobacteriales bacterium]|nr:VOC family protein [Mycobacteriales bacterium]